MCFSATASFSAVALLVPAGVYCAARGARLRSAYWVMGLLPLMFGIQQAAEGVVWLAINGGDAAVMRNAALGFMFFSHFFWLGWVPLASWAVEERTGKRNAFLVLSVIGALYGASMYLPVVLYPDWLTVEVVGKSISYEARLAYDGYLPRLLVRAIYAVIVLAPLLLSSQRDVRGFGLLIAISIAVAAVFFSYTFISVWCYFAAILSLFALFMVSRERQREMAMEPKV